ncbi:cysteine proteinase [Pseudovirgaria hyperparasitica]|uniref:ubiquitinyl hydrolase 1 n=1 Tax=Pseudovirgaria hyperparasitica TaxID=470096 RepID=A0A6A6WGV0_9PEZI|nr:cysteine proteinase [Pseudovirgaria hyperparasitica]KAF2760867.1 cysteine proteinase [Pseudovirgaria hyperparasitica]
MSPPRKRVKTSEDGSSSPSRSGPDTLVNGSVGKYSKSITHGATAQDKATWQGFCDIESEPALLNVMLREWGVRSARVREIFSLDDLGAEYSPKHVFGLVFCYQYFEPDYGMHEKSCPEHIWFANQLSTSSCATVTMLNILNNVPGLVLGENLQSFKDFTRTFEPFPRGEALAEFEFVKRIHNSFATRSDMMNFDLQMKGSFDTAMKAKAQQARREAQQAKQKARTGKTSTPRKKKKRKADDESDAEAAFHYQAFLPIGNELWKLDGMDYYPEKLGTFEEGQDWTEVFRPLLEERILLLSEQYGAEVNLMCLHKDEAAELREHLAQNIVSIRAADARLDTLQPDWRNFLEEDPGLIVGPNTDLGIDEDYLAKIKVPLPVQHRIDEDSPTMLIDFRTRLVDKQKAIDQSVLQVATADERQESEHARDSRSDYRSFHYQYLVELANAGCLRDVAEDVRAAKEAKGK